MSLVHNWSPAQLNTLIFSLIWEYKYCCSWVVWSCINDFALQTHIYCLLAILYDYPKGRQKVAQQPIKEYYIYLASWGHLYCLNVILHLFDAENCNSCRKTGFLLCVREYLIGVWHHQRLVVRDATIWPCSWCSSRNPFSPLHLLMTDPPRHPNQLILNHNRGKVESK